PEQQVDELAVPGGPDGTGLRDVIGQRGRRRGGGRYLLGQRGKVDELGRRHRLVEPAGTWPLHGDVVQPHRAPSLLVGASPGRSGRKGTAPSVAARPPVPTNLATASVRQRRARQGRVRGGSCSRDDSCGYGDLRGATRPFQGPDTVGLGAAVQPITTSGLTGIGAPVPTGRCGGISRAVTWVDARQTPAGSVHQRRYRRESDREWERRSSSRATTTRHPSRYWKDWKRSASARACTSARPASAACTNWSGKWWTTRS